MIIGKKRFEKYRRTTFEIEKLKNELIDLESKCYVNAQSLNGMPFTYEISKAVEVRSIEEVHLKMLIEEKTRQHMIERDKLIRFLNKQEDTKTAEMIKMKYINLCRKDEISKKTGIRPSRQDKRIELFFKKIEEEELTCTK